MTYTNFEVADESGVFVPNLGTFNLSLTNVDDGVNQYPGPFTHTVTGSPRQPETRDQDHVRGSRLLRAPIRRGRRPSLAP